MPEEERRQFKRVRLLQPIRGSVERRVVYIMDGSLGGLGVLHRGAFPAPGNPCPVVLYLPSEAIRVDCEVVRTVPRASDGESEFFQSGLKIVVADDAAVAQLRRVFPNG